MVTVNIYGPYNCPSENSILGTVESSGSVKDQTSAIYNHSGRSQENIHYVRESVAEDPKMSINRQQVGVLYHHIACFTKDYS